MFAAMQVGFASSSYEVNEADGSLEVIVTTNRPGVDFTNFVELDVVSDTAIGMYISLLNCMQILHLHWHRFDFNTWVATMLINYMQA